jgi:hypothetical protein
LLAALAGLMFGLFAIPAGAADTPTGGPNQVVIANVQSDGAWALRSGAQVAVFAGNTWTSANIAAATSTGCTGCHASAVAVQVILVTGSPNYAAPGNVATASTGGCTGCGSYAYAWQYFVFTSGPVHLSAAGQKSVTELRSEIAEVTGSILPSDGITDPDLVRDQQLDQELDSLTAQLKSVIDSEVQAAGASATGKVNRSTYDAPGT